MPPRSKLRHAPEDSVGVLTLGCCVDPANYVWMVVALFAFTLFLAALCCTSFIATRWIYKRRMKRKCEGLREKYRKEAEQRREAALAARRIAMRPPTTALRVDPSKEVLAKFVQLGRLQQQNADMRTAKEMSAERVQAMASNQAIPTQNALETKDAKLEAVNKMEEVNVSLRKAKSINKDTVPPDTVVVEPTQSPSDKPSLPLDPTPPSKSSSPSESSGYTVPTTTTTSTETSSSVSMETQKDTPTQSKASSSNAKPTESTTLTIATETTPITATEATPTASEAPPTNARFPYFSGPGVAHRAPRNKRSAWVENTPIRKDESNHRNPVERKMSSTSVSSFVTAGSGQPNAYDLRRMVLQGKGLRSDRTQPTSSASRESGYSHLRTLSKKDPFDFLKSVSLNGLPATREKK